MVTSDKYNLYIFFYILKMRLNFENVSKNHDSSSVNL